ncbi:MAG: nuclear transport factor 2 family protein [Chitinophagaceae bacterium]|nr:nuclear transport factor 2 family protein [Chitinophagaceae bacterium]
MEHNNTITEAISAEKETVLSFIEALNVKDYETAKRLVSKDLSFIGVLGSRQGADAYFQDMQKMQFTYDIQKVFANEHEVCLWYEIDMGGQKILTCGLYHLENNKIKSLKVLFDPRPVLEKSGK